MGENDRVFNQKTIRKSKRRSGFVIRLKSIKSIKELLCFLSSYINL